MHQVCPHLSISLERIVISEVEGRHQAGRGWNTAAMTPHLVLVLLQVLVLSPSASLVLLPVLFIGATSYKVLIMKSYKQQPEVKIWMQGSKADVLPLHTSSLEIKSPESKAVSIAGT